MDTESKNPQRVFGVAVKRLGAGPLDVAEQAFRLLATGPDPLALDCPDLPDDVAPDGRVAIGRLRELLLSGRLPVETRTELWREVISCSRTTGSGWSVVAAGLAMPGLRRVASRLAAAGTPLDREDVEGEVLTGFLAALASVDLTWGGLAHKLLTRTHRHAVAACFGEHGVPAVPLRDSDSMAPPPPYGHPDLVLARAVRAGVVTAAEAELIGATRLEGTSLVDAAARCGVSYRAVLARRRRAELRLADAITSGALDGVHLTAAPHDDTSRDDGGDERATAA